MKTTKLLCLIICLTLPLLVYAKTNLLKETPAHNVHSVHLDKIVAIVNSDVITQNELNKKMEMIGKQFGGNIPEKELPKLRTEVLEDMINTLLKLQLAQRSGMQISDAELSSIIANIAQKNHLTIDQFKKSLQEIEGLSFKAYRQQLRDQIIASRVEQRFLGKDLNISEKDVEKVLHNPPKMRETIAQYHVLDILIATPDKATAEQINTITKTANLIATKLRQETNVEKVVQEYNSDKQPVTIDDLGIRNTNELPDLFAKDIVKMKVGQIIGPIQAPNGLHLLKLIESQGAKSQNVKLTKEQAREIAFQQKLEELSKPWIKELREGAYIKIIN